MTSRRILERSDRLAVSGVCKCLVVVVVLVVMKMIVMKMIVFLYIIEGGVHVKMYWHM